MANLFVVPAKPQTFITPTLSTRGTGGGGSSIIVDSAMSTSSVNPVQNKVITSAIETVKYTVVIDA